MPFMTPGDLDPPPTALRDAKQAKADATCIMQLAAIATLATALVVGLAQPSPLRCSATKMSMSYERRTDAYGGFTEIPTAVQICTTYVPR